MWFGGPKSNSSVMEQPEPEDQPDQDAVDLQRLVNSGLDTSARHPFRHVVSVVTPHAAVLLRQQCIEAGYSSSACEAATHPGWMVVAERQEIPTLEGITLARSFFTLLCSRSPGSRYEGWALVDADDLDVRLDPDDLTAIRAALKRG